MRLNPRFFALSSAIVAAATYVICGVVVALAPGGMQSVLSYVLHIDLTQMSRSISATSFFVGLAVFGVFFYACAYSIAALYNVMQFRDELPATLSKATTR